jgi:hypothetical protein
MVFFFALILACALPQLNVAFRAPSFRSPLQISSSRGLRKHSSLQMSFGGIAEKLGGLVELVSGQKKITEANIEDTLKVINDSRGIMYSFMIIIWITLMI